MHIPDGFLNITTVATTYVVSAGGVGNAVRVANKKLGEKQVPLMGVLAAFIFAAQMLNFPVAGGTSGHVIGAALAAILLGPWAAVLIMSCVLIAQSLTLLLGDNRRGKLVGSAFGAWSSVFLASIACAIELALSGASPIGVVLPAMAGVHALIGIGEGLITVAVLSLVLATRADLMQLQRI